LTTFGRRLRQLREARGWDRHKAAKELGVHYSTIAKWENDERFPSGQDMLSRIATVFGVSLDELLGLLQVGNSTKPYEFPTQHTRAQLSELTTALRFAIVPLYGTVPAGQPNFVMDEPLDYVSIPENLVGHADFAVLVQGDSMIGLGIDDGDILLVRRQDTAGDGDIVIARVNGGEYTVKRLRLWPGRPPVLESGNPKYPPIESDDVAVIGKVVWIMRPVGTSRTER